MKVRSTKASTGVASTMANSVGASLSAGVSLRDEEGSATTLQRRVANRRLAASVAFATGAGAVFPRACVIRSATTRVDTEATREAWERDIGDVEVRECAPK